MQNDFAYVVQWIFAQVQNVLNLISQYWILKTALFVPIAGAAIVFVFYMLQDVNFTFPFVSDRDKSLLGVKSYAFGSVHSRKLNGSLSGNSFNGQLSNSSFNNTSHLKVSSVFHDLVGRFRSERKELDKLHQNKLDEMRKEQEAQLYKRHESVYTDSNGEVRYSVSYHRNSTTTPYETQLLDS